MSWGFIFDLAADLTSDAWKKVLATKAKAPKIPAAWPAGPKHSLASFFVLPKSCLGDSFAKILAYPALTASAVSRTTRASGNVHIEITTLIDRSNLEVGALLAPLLQAIGDAGGRGRLYVVNDGTGPPDDGWSSSIAAKKKMKTVPIGDVADYDELRDELTARLIPNLDELIASANAHKKKKKKKK